MVYKLINKCTLPDSITPATCEHQFGKGLLPLTVCKSDLPCTFRTQVELNAWDKYGVDVTNIKTEEEKTA